MILVTNLDKLKPRRRHRVAHRTAHRWQPCEIGGVVEVLRSKNVRDDEVVGEAGDEFLRFGIARGSSDGHDLAVRVSHGGMRCVRGRVDRVSCARRCASMLPRKAFLKDWHF